MKSCYSRHIQVSLIQCMLTSKGWDFTVLQAVAMLILETDSNYYNGGILVFLLGRLVCWLSERPENRKSK